MKTYALGCLVAVGVCCSAVAAEKELLPPAQVTQLVRQLDDDNYFVRERALDKLADAGSQVLPALGDALLDTSPEVAWRAGVAVEQIAINGDEKLVQRVADLLKKLSHKKPHLAKLAGELAIRQQWARHENAVGEIQSLGGRLTGGEGELFADAGLVPAMAIDVAELADVEEPVPVEDVPPRPAEAGIFGVIGAIARALVPGLRDLEAPPLPDDAVPGAALEALERSGLEGDESPDVEIVGRARIRPAAADVEIIEAEEPTVEVMEEVGLEAIAIDFGGEIGGDVEGLEEGGVSQITLDKRWLGGDEGLAHLKDVKGLVALQIEDARLTDAALKHLEAAPTLQQITLRGAKFTSAGLREFREKKPDVRIWAYGSAMMGVGADMGASPLVLNHVYPKSGAQDAGLHTGDIIRRIDDQEIKDFTDLMLSVYSRAVGDKLHVEYERAGKKHNVQVVLRSRQAVERGAEEVILRKPAAEDDPFK